MAPCFRLALHCRGAEVQSSCGWQRAGRCPCRRPLALPSGRSLRTPTDRCRRGERPPVLAAGSGRSPLSSRSVSAKNPDRSLPQPVPTVWRRSGSARPCCGLDGRSPVLRSQLLRPGRLDEWPSESLRSQRPAWQTPYRRSPAIHPIPEMAVRYSMQRSYSELQVAAPKPSREHPRARHSRLVDVLPRKSMP